MNALLRLLLRLYPRAFREEYGAEWLAAARQRTGHARAPRGRFSRLETIASILADTLRNAPAVWCPRTPPTRIGTRVRHERTSVMETLAKASRLPAGILQDIRHTLRRLRKAPAVTAVVVLTLGIGIGATTAIFSVVKGVLLDPLPYDHPERLVAVWTTAPGLGEDLLPQSVAVNAVYEDEARSFEAVGIWSPQRVSAVVGETPEELSAISVTDGLLRALGAQPLLGRVFTATDIDSAAPDTVLLSYGFWQSRFDGDPDVVGRALQLYGTPVEIIGVMPAGFRILDRSPDLYLSFQYDRARLTVTNFVFQSIGRLREGVSLGEATAELATLMPLAPERYPGGMTLELMDQAKGGPVLHPLKNDLLGNVGTVLWVVLGGVGLILLVACANVANLLLIRAEGRRRTNAIQTALGCSRVRAAGQILAESLILGILGGLAGLGLADAGISLLLTIAPAGLPRLHEIGLEPGVLLFAVGVSLVAGMLPGLVPLAHGWRVNLVGSLKDGAPGSGAGRDRHRTRNALVVAQIALALVLLVGSGLMVRTFAWLSHVNPGFAHDEEVLTFQLGIPRSDVPNLEDIGAAHEAMARRLEEMSGVVAVGLTTSVPMDHRAGFDPVYVEGFPLPEGQQPPIRRFKWVGGGYPNAIGNPVLAGRPITWDDIRQRARVVMITESIAREFWGEPAKAVGRRISTGFGPGDWREVVGVVGNVLDDGIDRGPVDIVYWPMVMEGFWRETRGDALFAQRAMGYVIRSPRVGTPGFLDEVRDTVWSMHPSRPLTAVRTMADYRRDSMARTSFAMVMLGVAAAVTLLLGVIGIYGVMAYSVGRRTREVGLRMAMGAEPGAVTGMILRQGLVLTGCGVLVGLGAAYGLTRLMTALLVGVSAADPATYALVSVVLIAVASVATYVPARRAARVDPAVALRTE